MQDMFQFFAFCRKMQVLPHLGKDTSGHHIIELT